MNLLPAKAARPVGRAALRRVRRPLGGRRWRGCPRRHGRCSSASGRMTCAAERAPRGPSFPAEVHLTEPLGDVTVLDLVAAGATFKMILPEAAAARYTVGDRLTVRIASRAYAPVYAGRPARPSAERTAGQRPERRHPPVVRRWQWKREEGMRLRICCWRPRSGRRRRRLSAPPAKAEDIVLKMAVPDWPPTHIMKDLTNKYYKAPSPATKSRSSPTSSRGRTTTTGWRRR